MINVLLSSVLSLTLALSLFITPNVLFADDKNANKVVCARMDGSETNDPYFAYNLGMASMRSKNYDQALVCLKKAYEIGNDEVKSSAANSLGYYHRQDKVKNIQEAIKWYKIAIEIDNSVDSIYNLGIIYEEEFRDYPKAIEWYEKAHQQKDKSAAYAIGFIYKNTLK
ncbi:MAG: sel1 repeat family protein, partial [Helicobacteraceae bacterium]|nr:sel1 repeat family protein [Helicobacteraceae bacterium]